MGTGLRHIGEYRDAVPTHRKTQETVNIMQDMNQTLGHELFELKKFLLNTTSRVAALEGSRSSRMQRSKTAVGGERTRASARRKLGKSILWDPSLQKSLPVQSPTTRAKSTDISMKDSQHRTYPIGPLGMSKHAPPLSSTRYRG